MFALYGSSSTPRWESADSSVRRIVPAALRQTVTSEIFIFCPPPSTVSA